MRERRYTWTPHEPGIYPTATRSGADYLRGLIDGTLPEQPISSTIGWSVIEVGEGRLTLGFEAAGWLFQAAGRMHGGAVATMLDSAASGAVLSACPPGTGTTTAQLSINFIEGIGETDGPFVAEGFVVSMGHRIAVGESIVRGASGRLYARATATCVLIRAGQLQKTVGESNNG